jgi:type II secretory pathway component PulJ
VLSAFSRMEGYKGRPTLSKENLALIEGDTEERRKQNRDIIVRYEDAHGVHYDRDSLAEKARLRLRDVGRSE